MVDVVAVGDGRGPVPLADFAREHGLALTRFALLVTADRSRAEDVVQDVLLGMHRRFGAVVDVDEPLAYARRAIVNAQVSRARRRRVVELLTDRLPEPATFAEDLSSDVASVDDEIRAALATLPDRQRVVLVLRYFIGCPDEEIAALLHCRRSSVRSLATRAFTTLRPVLRPARPSAVPLDPEHALAPNEEISW